MLQLRGLVPQEMTRISSKMRLAPINTNQYVCACAFATSVRTFKEELVRHKLVGLALVDGMKNKT